MRQDPYPDIPIVAVGDGYVPGFKIAEGTIALSRDGHAIIVWRDDPTAVVPLDVDRLPDGWQLEANVFKSEAEAVAAVAD